MKDIQNATPGGYRDSPQPAAANPKRVALWHQIASADRVLDRVTSAHQIHLSRRLTGSSSSTITTIAYTLYSLWLCPIHCTFRCIRHPSPITGDLARHIISPSLSCFKCFEALSTWSKFYPYLSICWSLRYDLTGDAIILSLPSVPYHLDTPLTSIHSTHIRLLHEWPPKGTDPLYALDRPPWYLDFGEGEYTIII